MKNFHVLLAYEKEINTKADALYPSKVVRGNVILTLPERTIDFFNIPTVDISVFTEDVESYSRLIGKAKVKVSGYTRHKRGINQGLKVNLLPKKKPNRGAFLINFPYFFNVSMIRDALFLLIAKNKSLCRFQVLPSQKKRDIFIPNEGPYPNNMVKVWIPKKPITAKNTELTNKWGSICLMNPLSSLKTSRAKNF